MVIVVEKYLKDWFEMETIWFHPYMEVPPADVIIVDESDERLLQGHSPSITPLIILGSREFWSKKFMTNSTNTIVLTKPVGPTNLANALVTSLTSSIVEKIQPDAMVMKKGTASDPSTPASLRESHPIAAIPAADGRRSSVSQVTKTKTSSLNSNIPGNEGKAAEISPPLRIKPPVTTNSTRQALPRQISLSQILKGPAALVVDDNHINLSLLLNFVKKQLLGDVDGAEDGQIALDKVEACSLNYNIIFMNLSMPGMDGFEATRRIRLLEKTDRPSQKPAFIVALTDLAAEQDRAKASACGVDLYLTKTVSFMRVKGLLKERGLLKDPKQ